MDTVPETVNNTLKLVNLLQVLKSEKETAWDKLIEAYTHFGPKFTILYSYFQSPSFKSGLDDLGRAKVVQQIITQFNKNKSKCTLCTFFV